MWLPSGKTTRHFQAAGIAVFSLVLCAAANAQVPTGGNVFFGYSFENAAASSFDLANLGRPNLNGWEASLEGKVFPLLSVVVDFGGHYGSQSYQTPLPPNGTIGTVAVSYTHLDVYKRQAVECVAQKDVGITRERRHALLNARAARIVQADHGSAHLRGQVHDLDDLRRVRLGAVSYTHLDVYKRQR